MKRSYQEVLDFLFTSLPVYQKIGGKAIKVDLGNIRSLCAALDNPQEELKVIHIAGTNGKGSVSSMIASILKAAGFRTGLYTSPHFLDFRERIRIDGECISEDAVVDFVELNKNLFEEIRPSFFEMTVAMAFAHFAESNVDFAVIEVGLGGRLDSTNIVDPVLSVITNIALDHQEFLGDTLPKIAAEKAGIIKHKRPLVLGVDDPAYRFVFEETSTTLDAPLRIAETEINVDMLERIEDGMRIKINSDLRSLPAEVLLPLHGLYQLKNVATALCAIDQLRGDRIINIDEVEIKKGLEDLSAKNSLMGRWQVLQKSPRIIADGAHNVAGMQQVIKNLSQESFERLHIVIGFSGDKKYEAMLDLLPCDAHYYFCLADIHRALPLMHLEEYADQNGRKAHYFEHVAAGLSAAVDGAGDHDLIFIGGSIYVVAEVMRALL